MDIKDHINIATDFSDHPGSRYREDGEFSGQDFLEKILQPKFEKAVEGDYLLEINLDKVYGYPSSFISGSFGKLALEKGSDLVLKHIVLISNDNPLNMEKVNREMKNPKK